MDQGSKKSSSTCIFFPDPKDADDEEFQQAKRLIGDDAVVGFWVHYPAPDVRLSGWSRERLL